MKRGLLLVATSAITLRAFLLPYARYFRRLGWRVDGLAGGASECAQCVDAFDTAYDISWTRSPTDIRQILESRRRVREITRGGAYDIVHVHTPIAAFATRWALRTRPSRCKVVYTAHGFHFHENGRPLANCAFERLEKLAGRWTDHMVVINSDDEQAARRLRLIDAQRLTRFPGIGIDLNRYSVQTVAAQAAAEIREQLRVSRSEKLLLMIAEFASGKRHRDALAALAKLGRKDIHLAFAGTGSAEAQMRALAASLQIGDRTHFLGFRGDVPVLLRACDGFLLPSEREGLPRSMLEAMAMRVPVIGTAIRGVRDLLAGGAGVCVPVGDAAALAAALAKVADDAPAVASMVEKASARVQEFALPRLLSLHDALYRELIDGQPGAESRTEPV